MSVVEVAPINHIVLIDGQPRIADKGLKIGFIVDWVLNRHWSVDDVARDYELTHAQIYAALSYYYDHRAEIDEWIAFQNQPVPEELLEESRKSRAEMIARYERLKAEQAKNGAPDTEGNE